MSASPQQAAPHAPSLTGLPEEDAWQVLPISLLVAPILLPAALVVGATLVVWYVFELVLWVL